MTVLSPSDFVKTFKGRRDICRNLLELSRHQNRLITDDDYALLMDLLQKKQRLLGRLDEFDRMRPGLWQQWKQQRDCIDTETRRNCEQLLADSESILAELLNYEKDGTEALAQRRNSTQKQLQEISQGTLVHEVYRDSLAPATHRHLDINQ